jgi:hypothetical protein
VKKILIALAIVLVVCIAGLFVMAVEAPATERTRSEAHDYNA